MQYWHGTPCQEHSVEISTNSREDNLMCETGDLLKAEVFIYFAFNPTAVSEKDVERYNF